MRRGEEEREWKEEKASESGAQLADDGLGLGWVAFGYLCALSYRVYISIAGVEGWARASMLLYLCLLFFVLHLVFILSCTYLYPVDQLIRPVITRLVRSVVDWERDPYVFIFS